MTNPDPVGGAAAQRAAKAELAHHEYRHGSESWTMRALHWIGHQGARLFGSGGGSHALLLVAIVLVIAALAFAVRAGLPRRPQRADSPESVDPLQVADARNHRRLAEELTRAGRRAEALREWLRAAIATIEERGVLPPRPGRTGATTAREAGPLLPRAAAPLSAATQAFDEVWFGGREATDADVAQARAAADAVQSDRLVAAAEAAPARLAVPQ